jgi:hypothetical protein
MAEYKKKGGLRQVGALWRSDPGKKSIASGFLDFGLLGQVRLIIMPPWGEGKDAKRWNILIDSEDTLTAKIEVTSDPEEIERKAIEEYTRKNDLDVPFGKTGGTGPSDPSHGQARAAAVQPRKCPVFQYEPGHKPGQNHVKDLVTPPIVCACAIDPGGRGTEVEDDIPF